MKLSGEIFPDSFFFYIGSRRSVSRLKQCRNKKTDWEWIFKSNLFPDNSVRVTGLYQLIN